MVGLVVEALGSSAASHLTRAAPHHVCGQVRGDEVVKPSDLGGWRRCWGRLPSHVEGLCRMEGAKHLDRHDHEAKSIRWKEAWRSLGG